MNLQVNLILETEKRSPSLINRKFLIRLSMIVGPAILAVIIGYAVVGSLRLRTEETNLRTRWKGLEPKKKTAESLATDVAHNVGVLKALEGWPVSRLSMREQIEGVVRHTPADIQLTSVTISHDLRIADRSVPGRFHVMNIEGKSVGANAEDNIQMLVQRLKASPPFAGAIQNVTMTGKADTSQGASRTDRVFSIVCVYAPRYFTE